MTSINHLITHPETHSGSGDVSVCIACVGNELARDDGVGMRMGRILRELPLPSSVSVRFYPQVSLDLLDDLVGAERFILCDAMRTGACPGTISVLSWEQVASLSRSPYCCHGVGLSDLIAIAAELTVEGRSLSVNLVGVEAESFTEYGTELSRAVEAALPIAVCKVLELVGASPAMVSRAEHLARTLPAASPLTAWGG
jgi:hydrogenase maturation protease